MRFTVLGATGGTGRALIGQAAAAGHEVTAVVRDARGLSATDRVRVVTADVCDAKALVPLIQGADAVLSTLGSRGGPPPIRILQDSAAATLDAMHTAGVRRLVIVSAAGAVVDDGDSAAMRYVFKPILQRFLRHAFADTLRMEAQVMASDIDWTIVRPPRLTDAPRTGRYRTRTGLNLRGGRVISRADLADAVLRAVADPTLVRTTWSVAY